MENTMTKDSATVGWSATDADVALERYALAVGGAEGLSEWVQAEHREALADLLVSCSDLLDSWANCQRLGEGAATAASKERLLDVHAKVSDLLVCGERVRHVREVAAVADEMRRRATALGAELDAKTTAHVAELSERMRGSGWAAHDTETEQ